MTTTETASRMVARSKQASPTTKREKPASRVFGTSSQFRNVVVEPMGKPGRSDTPLKY